MTYLPAALFWMIVGASFPSLSHQQSVLFCEEDPVNPQRALTRQPLSAQSFFNPPEAAAHVPSLEGARDNRVQSPQKANRRRLPS